MVTIHSHLAEFVNTVNTLSYPFTCAPTENQVHWVSSWVLARCSGSKIWTLPSSVRLSPRSIDLTYPRRTAGAKCFSPWATWLENDWLRQNIDTWELGKYKPLPDCTEAYKKGTISYKCTQCTYSKILYQCNILQRNVNREVKLSSNKSYQNRKMSLTIHCKYKYFDSTVQRAEDRRQKFYFCRLP